MVDVLLLLAGTEPEVDPALNPGPLAFVVIFTVVVATVLLCMSMVRQFKKVTFPEDDESGGSDRTTTSEISGDEDTRLG